MRVVDRTDDNTAAEGPTALHQVYEDGRRDEEVRHPHPLRTPDKMTREAYREGRRDERHRKHGFPLLRLFLVIVAFAGAALLYLAYREGSFTGGGAAIDRQIANTADTTAEATHRVADTTGSALENAGQRIKQAAPPPKAP